MPNKLWEEILKIYKEKFNIEPEVVDMVACSEILRQSCEGLSNETIKILTEYEPDYIRDILKLYFHFEGFESDLDFSPIGTYDHVDGDTYEFLLKVNLLNKSKISTENLYEICKRYSQIRKEIENKYVQHKIT